MSTLIPPSPLESEDRHDAEALEALIEEARQRARRRRRRYAALAFVAVAAGVLGFSVLDSGGGGTGTAEGDGGGGAQVTDGRWRPAPGLEGGTITALAVDPLRPDTVFAATVHAGVRSEEHTSELQSLRHLVCRLLLEKKKKTYRSKVLKHKNTY